MFSCGKPSLEFLYITTFRAPKNYLLIEAASCVVDMKVHHGGAGTTATGLKAGVKHFNFTYKYLTFLLITKESLSVFLTS